MSSEKAKTDYQKLIQKCSAPRPAQKSAEECLDALLAGSPSGAEKPKIEASPEPAAPMSSMDTLRRLMSDELIPVFEGIKEKYQAYGIELSLDVSDFLLGGRRVVIEFNMPERGLKLEGTAVSEGIAFNEIHSYGGFPGAISSGPMLRSRHLTGDRFRDFICTQLAPLVRTKLKQK